jgi:hypothetical protein
MQTDDGKDPTLGFVKLLDHIPTKRKRAKIRREVREENATRST